MHRRRKKGVSQFLDTTPRESGVLCFLVGYKILRDWCNGNTAVFQTVNVSPILASRTKNLAVGEVWARQYPYI